MIMMMMMMMMMMIIIIIIIIIIIQGANFTRNRKVTGSNGTKFTETSGVLPEF